MICPTLVAENTMVWFECLKYYPERFIQKDKSLEEVDGNSKR